jgi:hypothetical protein
MSDASSTYTLTSQELAAAKGVLAALQERLIIKVNLTRNSLSEQFRTFIEELASVSEHLQPLYLTHSEDLLVDRLAKSDPSSFHPDSFKKIIKEGDAERLAGMMVADGDLYSESAELLADPDWSMRMGMMVVLEGVAARSPDLVQRAYPYILDLLKHEDDNQRGDTAYLLGLIGDASVMDRLEVLLNDANPQVVEVAFEAVQRIRQRETLGK